VLPLAVRREFIERIVGCGLRRIEVASFVNPRRVPQMADADELVRSLPRHAGVRYVGLVLNRRGFDRALAAGCDEVGMVVVVTDTFNLRNQGATTAESTAAWLEMARAAKAAGVRAQVTISAAFGCPFEGEVPPAKVVALARALAEGEPVEIAVADSIGAGVPAQVTDLLGRLKQALPGMRLRCHFHNTRNTGIANAYAAVEAGVDTLDASIGGIGGCPFAPAATGNIPTEDLVYMLERMRIATGVDLARTIDTARWLEEQTGRKVPGLLTKAGGFPAAKEST
jgi:hydroxymethylglutaryl-CoA lyase